VSISTTLFEQLFVCLCFAQLFSNYSLSLKIFCQKNMGSKAACEVLGNLTTELPKRTFVRKEKPPYGLTIFKVTMLTFFDFAL
jgi:hypothetical protein